MSGEVSNVMRVMLLRRETYRVAQGYRELRVRSGRAWITMNGHDHVLKRGEEIALQSTGDGAVVSPLGSAPLVIELRGAAPRRPRLNLRPVVSTR